MSFIREIRSMKQNAYSAKFILCNWSLFFATNRKKDSNKPTACFHLKALLTKARGESISHCFTHTWGLQCQLLRHGIQQMSETMSETNGDSLICWGFLDVPFFGTVSTNLNEDRYGSFLRLSFFSMPRMHRPGRFRSASRCRLPG